MYFKDFQNRKYIIGFLIVPFTGALKHTHIKHT